jgi:Putative peptidoglycan binding domain
MIFYKKNTMKHLLFFLFLLCANTTFAQSETPEFPFDTTGLPKTFIEKPETGACYAFIYQPDIYATPDGKRYEVFTKKRKYMEPAYNYTTIKEWHHFLPRLERKPNVEIPENIQLLDPVYKEIKTQNEVIAASTIWQRKRGDANCLSVKPIFAQAFCLVEIPAQYQTIVEKLEEVKPARKIIGKDTIALDSATLFQYYWEVKEKMQVMHSQRKIIKKGRVFYTDTFYCAEPLPKDAVLVEKGGISEWRKINCSDCGGLRPSRLPEIQLVLQKKGYYKGNIDGVLGDKMKKALIQFQKDNKLPIGSIDLKTLKALGIDDY